jgi:hypothetical protein
MVQARSVFPSAECANVDAVTEDVTAGQNRGHVSPFPFVSSRDMASSSNIPAHELVVVPSPGNPERIVLRQQCYDVRIAVFVDEQRFPLDVEIDE